MGVVRMRVGREVQSPFNSCLLGSKQIILIFFIRVALLSYFFVSFDTCYITKHLFTETSGKQ